MKAVLTVLGCVLAAIVVFAVVRDQISSDSDSGSASGSSSLGLGGGGGSGAAGGGGGSGGGGGGGGGRPDVTTGTTGTTTDSTGTPDVTQRGTNGSDRVDCSDIDSELKITAHDGAIRWQATGPSGVSASPASGFLDEGESEVVRIGGSYSDSAGFTVVVSAPNRAGSGSVSVPFTCV